MKQVFATISSFAFAFYFGTNPVEVILLVVGILSMAATVDTILQDFKKSLI